MIKGVSDGVIEFSYHSIFGLDNLDRADIIEYGRNGYVRACYGEYSKSRFNYSRRKGITDRRTIGKEKFSKVLNLIYTDIKEIDNEGGCVMSAILNETGKRVSVDVFVDSVLISAEEEVKQYIMKVLRDNNVKYRIMASYIFVERDNYNKYGRKKDIRE